MKLWSWETERNGSVRLAQWLDAQGVYFALRPKKSTYIQQPGQDYQRLDSRLVSSRYEDIFNGNRLSLKPATYNLQPLIYDKSHDWIRDFFLM